MSGKTGGFGRKLNIIMTGLDDLKETINVVAGSAGEIKEDIGDIKKSVGDLKSNFSGFDSVKAVASEVLNLAEDVSAINDELPLDTVGNGIAEGMRSTMGKNDDKRDEGLTTPENVERFDDTQYGPDPDWNVLDVYRPKGEAGILPVIFSIHGGGWLYGDKERYQFYCMDLVSRGFAVINFSYRLAPENKYPACLEDTNLAVKWMLEHGNEYQLDLNNIFFVGDSAGGHLAGLYSCLCTNKEFAAKYDFTVPEGFVPKAVGLNCGAYDPMSFMQDNKLWESTIIADRAQLDPEWINVSSNVNEKFPPTYIVSSTGDFCYKYFEPLKTCLEEHGVEVESKVYGSEENKLGHVFHLDIRSADGRQCNDDECGFFRRHIS